MRPAPRTEAGGGHDGHRPGSLFADRRDAGRVLAERLRFWAGTHPVVLGLPRGGVVVAYQVARALDAPLDVIVTRKIGAPGNPELALGAVAEGDVRVFNAAELRWAGLTAAELERSAGCAVHEVDRRVALYRGSRLAIPLAGRSAIVVDDGLATGATALAALRAVRQRGPRTLVLAAPVGARETVNALAHEADHVTCLETPERLEAIAECYEDFGQASDADVIGLLLARQRERRSADLHRRTRASADAR